MKTDGTCLQDAFKLTQEMYRNGIKEVILCQGLVYGSKFGFWYPHSWVEIGDMVFDFSNGSSYINRKEKYYEYLKIKKTKRFTFKEIVDIITKTGYFKFDKIYKEDFKKINLLIKKEKGKK